MTASIPLGESEVHVERQRAAAALELVRALGIDAAKLVGTGEEWAALHNIPRAALNLYGADGISERVVYLALPEPTPPPEPVDIALAALQRADALLASVPLGGKAHDAHDVIIGALAELGLTTEADEPSADPDPEPVLPTVERVILDRLNSLPEQPYPRLTKDVLAEVIALGIRTAFSALDRGGAP